MRHAVSDHDRTWKVCLLTTRLHQPQMEMAEDESRRWHEHVREHHMISFSREASLIASTYYITVQYVASNSTCIFGTRTLVILVEESYQRLNHKSPPKPSERPSSSRPPRHEEHAPKFSRSTLSLAASKVEEESDVDNSQILQHRSQPLLGDYNDPRRRAYPEADTSRRSKALLQLPESENSVRGDDVYEESDDELNGIDSTSTTQVMHDHSQSAQTPADC